VRGTLGLSVAFSDSFAGLSHSAGSSKSGQRPARRLGAEVNRSLRMLVLPSCTGRPRHRDASPRDSAVGFHSSLSWGQIRRRFRLPYKPGCSESGCRVVGRLSWQAGISRAAERGSAARPASRLGSTDCSWYAQGLMPSSFLQIIKDGEEHDDLNEVAKLFNIHED